MTDAPSSTIRPRGRDTVLAVVDVVATFVFALEGAPSAIAHRLDVFGVLVLAIATSTTGAIVRDLLIGYVPPASIRHRRYFIAAIGTFRRSFASTPTRSQRCWARRSWCSG